MVIVDIGQEKQINQKTKVIKNINACIFLKSVNNLILYHYTKITLKSILDNK